MISLLVRLQQPNTVLAQRMLASVLNQSNNSWELVLVASNNSPAEQEIAQLLTEGHPHIRVELRPEGELLAWSCNALLGTLGDWIGFLGQHDQLTPDALDAMAATIAANPQARVIYSDEQALGTWGQVSLQFAKGSPDPIRLLSEEYLRDLALIQKNWLQTIGGFDRQESDQPSHGVYLRLMESTGVAGFAHTPKRLYLRHRNRLLPRGTDPRGKPYLPQYDLQAVRKHYERAGIPVKIRQLNGTLDTEFHFTKAPSATILLVLGDDLSEGRARLAGVRAHTLYEPCAVLVLFNGQSAQAFSRYADLCRGMQLSLRRVMGNLPAALNQEVSQADTDLVVILQGVPLNDLWLRRMVDLTHLPEIKACSPTLITPVHQLDGGPWDTRGQMNQLAVPHSVSMLSPTCMLVDTRKFLELGGFETAYPTLYGMDFSLRLIRSGNGCVRTPRSQVQVASWAMPEPAELNLFREAWVGWEDPYLLHQLP